MQMSDRRSIRERVGALRNLRPFIAMVWRTSPSLTLTSLVLRLMRALLPVATLFVGKLIIDEVVLLVQMPDKPGTFGQWLEAAFSTGWACCLRPSSLWRSWPMFWGGSSRWSTACFPNA